MSESFETLLSLAHPGNDTMPTSSEDRTRQWIACRIALRHLLSDDQLTISKDNYGKPHVNTNVHIALSHTNNFATAIISERAVGIDIEEITPRIRRIAHRFVHQDELIEPSSEPALEYLYLLWCAKEALYKLYGKKAVDFKTDIRVQPFDVQQDGTFELSFLKYGNEKFTAHYQFFDNHAMVWIVAD